MHTLRPSEHRNCRNAKKCCIRYYTVTCTHKQLPTRKQENTHTHTTILLLFWSMSGTTRVSRYQKGKTRKVKANLGLLEQEIVSGSGMCWLYASLLLIPDNHANIPPLSFLQARCPSCHPTNSVKEINAGKTYSPQGRHAAQANKVVNILWQKFSRKWKLWIYIYSNNDVASRLQQCFPTFYWAMTPLNSYSDVGSSRVISAMLC